MRAPTCAYRLILNVPARGALTPQELKKAYLRCSLHLHPDKNGAADATAAFRRVGAAYEVLGLLAEGPSLPAPWIAMKLSKHEGKVAYYNVVTDDASETKPE